MRTPPRVGGVSLDLRKARLDDGCRVKALHRVLEVGTDVQLLDVLVEEALGVGLPSGFPDHDALDGHGGPQPGERVEPSHRPRHDLRAVVAFAALLDDRRGEDSDELVLGEAVDVEGAPFRGVAFQGLLEFHCWSSPVERCADLSIFSRRKQVYSPCIYQGFPAQCAHYGISPDEDFWRSERQGD